MADGAPTKKEGFLRVTTRMWESPQVRALRPSTRDVWVYLGARCVPDRWVALSSSKIAKALKRNDRNVRRSLDELEAGRFIDIERSVGGSHENRNRYMLLPWEQAIVCPRQKQPTKAPAATKAPTDTGAPADELTPETVTEADLQRLAAAYEQRQAAPPSPPTDETPKQAAIRMVAEFHAAVRMDHPAHPERPPLQKEIRLALGLLQHHGAEAWELVSQAIRRMRQMSKKEAATFLFLQIHLDKLGARYTLAA